MPFFILGESKQANGELGEKASSPSLAHMDVVVMCPHASPHTSTINVTTTPSNVFRSLKYDGAPYDSCEWAWCYYCISSFEMG